MQAGQVSRGRPRCVVYVDGYNWYHAVFRDNPQWKWLNVQAFFEALRSDDDVTAIKLFSAWVTDGDGHERQKKYFDALKTLPKVKIKCGIFQPREVHCKATCRERYIVQDEKKTDVNIALEMISDAIDGNVDRICVVSGDSDVQPAIEWIVSRFRAIRILVYIPCLPSNRRDRRTDYYSNKGLHGVSCGFLPLENLGEHQLKPVVRVQDSPPLFVSRPSTWAAGGEVPVH
jgi:6-hydroxy-3-succinoylpyridine 3-monooxygenase